MANSSSSSGMGFSSALQLIFIILKLCNVITWSWFWVLAPTWISIGIVLAVLLVLAIIAIIAAIITACA